VAATHGYITVNIWAEGELERHPNQWSVDFGTTLKKGEERERNTASDWISHYKLLIVRSKSHATYYESALDDTIIRFRLGKVVDETQHVPRAIRRKRTVI
jgi:hypothetical protein